MPFIQARAKFTNGDGRVVTDSSNNLSVNKVLGVLPNDLRSDKLLVMLGALNLTKFYFVAGDKLVIEKITSTTPEVVTRTGVINVTKTGWQLLSDIAPTGFKETESGGSNLFFNRYYIEPVEYAGDRYYSTAYTLERISSINFCNRLIFAASELAPAGIRDQYASMSLWGETNPDTGVSALVIPAHMEDLSGLFDNAGTIIPFSANAALPKIITLGKIKKMHRTFYNAFAYGMFTYSTPEGAVVFGEMDVSEVTDFSYCFGQCFQANPDIENWDVSSATNMTGMFHILVDWTTDKWTRNLSKWCVSKITSEPANFSTNHPMSAAQKPVWGTCPNPSLTSTASWYKNASLTTPVGSSTNLRDTYCVFDLKNVKGGEVLELTGHAYTLTTYTVDVTLLSDSSKLTSPIGFNTLYALYKSPDRGNIPMRTIPITIPQGITGNVRLVFKSSAFTLHHSLDSGSSRFDFILKHNNVQIGAIATVYRS